MSSDLLSIVGERIQELRLGLGWSRRRLSEEAGVSQRFLAEVEGGQGNISLLKLEQIADALNTTPGELLRGRFEPRRRGSVALLGLRGAGKSTVGPELARELARPFVELDELVERAAGMSSAEIFAMHGEEYFRRLEHDVLAKHLGESAPSIIATGGGIVADPATFQLLQRNATTVWLKARPEDHWARVVAQGDTRPMADHPQAMAELERILALREPLYARADHTVDTTGRTAAQVCDQIAAALA